MSVDMEVHVSTTSEKDADVAYFGSCSTVCDVRFRAEALVSATDKVASLGLRR
jgi:hypothetical protein